MNNAFNKPHLSMPEQIQRLRDRGMRIDATEYAIEHLSIIGYYRLSSYWYHMEIPAESEDERSHNFLPGTTFEDVVRVYVYDQRLRLLVLEALERLEIGIRAKWAHYLSEESGSHAHLNPECFHDRSEHLKSLGILIGEVERSRLNSCEIRHYLKNYNMPVIPPIWSIVSCMSFGELIRWVHNTESITVKRRIAKDVLGVPNLNLFDGITRQLGTVRNICAHHGRLWDQRFITRMPLVQTHLKAPMVAVQENITNRKTIADNRIYNTLLILGHLMLLLSPGSSWPSRVADLTKSSLPARLISVMGAPENWDKELLWQK